MIPPVDDYYEDLFDWLLCKGHGFLWACRPSTTGRGWRLCTHTPAELKALGIKGFERPVDAVEDAMKRYP